MTHKSVLELARDLGFTAEEAPITIEEAMQADEVFTTGTAVVLSPVGSLTYKGSKKVFGKPGAGGEQHVWTRGKLTGLNGSPRMPCRQIRAKSAYDRGPHFCQTWGSPVEVVVQLKPFAALRS